MKKSIYTLLIACSALGFTACEDLLEVEPVNLITDDKVIIDAESAEGAVLGIYSRIQTTDLYGHLLIAMPGVLSDELTHSGSFPTVADLDNNTVQANNVTMSAAWQQAYRGIYQANTVINMLPEATIPGLSAEEARVLVGEARFLRALLHFELVKLYGGVPLATTTSVEELSTLPRSTEAEVYNFIIEELKTAATELQGANLETRYRAGEWAAKAILARAYLYSGNKAEAGRVADDVIKNSPYALEAKYRDIFTPKSASNEVIFRVFASATDPSSIAFWLLPNGRFEYAVSPKLVEAYEPGSPRAMIEVNGGDPLGRYHVNKYTDLATGTDEIVVVRLAEMYLIRAEANIGSSQAIADVNTVRGRAGLEPVSAVNLNTILDERFTELAFEGHRWFDLKRTDVINEVMSDINPNTWQPTDRLLPIPQREIDNNPAITPEDQNPGY